MLTKQDVLADDGLFRKSAAIVRAEIEGVRTLIRLKSDPADITAYICMRMAHAASVVGIRKLQARPAICYAEEGERQYLEDNQVIATLGPGGVVL